MSIRLSLDQATKTNIPTLCDTEKYMPDNQYYAAIQILLEKVGADVLSECKPQY
jgi:hypothetical protein